jgi:hypothetical protein
MFSTLKAAADVTVTFGALVLRACSLTYDLSASPEVIVKGTVSAADTGVASTTTGLSFFVCCSIWWPGIQLPTTTYYKQYLVLKAK